MDSTPCFDAGTTLALAFHRHGGFVTVDDFACVLRRRQSQPLSTLAKWIVHRKIVSLRGHGAVVLPVFQFVDSYPVDGLDGVLSELAHLDDLDLASWFIEPNAWFGGDSPAARLRHDPISVQAAARADRWALFG